MKGFPIGFWECLSQIYIFGVPRPAALGSNLRSRFPPHWETVDVRPSYIHECGHGLFDRLGWKQSVEDQLQEVISDTYGVWMTETFYLKFK